MVAVGMPSLACRGAQLLWLRLESHRGSARVSRRVVGPVLGRLAVVLLAVVLVAGCSDEDDDGGEAGSDAVGEQEGNETAPDDSDAGSDATDADSGDADAPVSTVTTTTTTEAPTTTATTTTTEPPATTTTAGVRTTSRPRTTRAPATTQPPATTTTAAATSSTTTTTSTTTTVPPLEPVWTATLTPRLETNWGTGLGAGTGYGAGAGDLSPNEYEYETGSTATFERLVHLTDDADRLYVLVGSGEGAGLVGLWLKLSDDLAVQLGEPENLLQRVDRWLIDLGEDSLDWSDGNDYEVSLWDSQPPGTAEPRLPLWTATLTVGYEADYFAGSSALGYGHGSIGVLDPVGFEHPPGNAVTVSSLLLYPDDSDRLYVTASGGLEGLWVKAAGHLAVEVGASQGKTAADDDLWNFDIPEGSLLWESGDTVEVSIWDEEPPLSEPPPRRLWSATMTSGTDDAQTRYGYSDGHYGVLTADQYDYEQGRSARFARLTGHVESDGTDRLEIASYNAQQSYDPSVLEGLWLKVSDGFSVELGDDAFTLGDTDRWAFHVPEAGLGWTSGSDHEVSLWDSQPPGTTALSPALQALWQSDLRAAQEDYGGSLGTGLGYGSDVNGTLSTSMYEYAPGSSAEITRIVLLTDDDDRLWVGAATEAGASGLEGLWLQVSDDLAFELGTPGTVPGGSDNRHWFFDLEEEGALDWSDDSWYVVRLWSQDPATARAPSG